MKRIITLLPALALAGCSSALIIPGADGQYQSIAEYDNQNGALKIALKDAKKTCENKLKTHQVIDTKTDYQGDKLESLADNLLSITAAATNTLYYSGIQEDDYKVTLTFKCV